MLLFFSFFIKINATDYSSYSTKALLTELKNDIPSEAMLYYHALDDDEKAHYNGILESYLLGNLESNYTFTRASGSTDELNETKEAIIRAFKAFSHEHKEFFFIGTYYLTSYQSIPPTHEDIEFKLEILLAEDYYQTFDKTDLSTRVINEVKVKQHIIEILNKRDLIKNHLDTLTSDYDKIKHIHDYLVLTNEYQKTNELSHTPAGALIDGETPVCEAYSEAFQMLAHHNNLIVSYATGNADNGIDIEAHAWNHVKLGTYWYLIDVTWDDPLGSGVDHISYDYFLIPKLSLDKRTYDIDVIVPTPFSTTSYGTKETYTITITIDDKTYTQSVLEGDNVDFSLYEKEGYRLVVTGLHENITSDGAVSITYEIQTFTITFVSDYKVISTQTVNYNELPTPPENPTKDRFVFNGWNPSLKKATEDQTYEATWVLSDEFTAPVEEGNPFQMVLIIGAVGLVGMVLLIVLFKLLFKKK